ncbi:hypothetical protein CBR_g2822 [Chara braunii]|nr:hypothetical protein CBR_g2822 [Chara braunii]|eukprot:GBG68274.1 hypothetical protein CBR_g2822 [Chara braunii]
MGVHRRGRTLLHVEEAVFLLERGSLLLVIGGNTAASVQQGYELLALQQFPVDAYQVYAHLRRLGYILGRTGVPWICSAKNESMKRKQLSIEEQQSIVSHESQSQIERETGSTASLCPHGGCGDDGHLHDKEAKSSSVANACRKSGSTCAEEASHFTLADVVGGVPRGNTGPREQSISALRMVSVSGEPFQSQSQEQKDDLRRMGVESRGHRLPIVCNGNYRATLTTTGRTGLLNAEPTLPPTVLSGSSGLTELPPPQQADRVRHPVADPGEYLPVDKGKVVEKVVSSPSLPTNVMHPLHALSLPPLRAARLTPYPSRYVLGNILETANVKEEQIANSAESDGPPTEALSWKESGQIGHRSASIATDMEKKTKELRPLYDVYLPNSKFSKKKPGMPIFRLCITSDRPPTHMEMHSMQEVNNGGIPLKYALVDTSGSLAVKAAQLQADEAATAEKLRLQAEADTDAQARRKEAQALLQRHEASSIEKLKYWHFEPNGDEPTPEEQHKEFMAKLVSRLVYTCNHLQSELANLQRAVRKQKTQHEDATRALDARVHDLEQVPPRQDAGASSSASSSRQLEERVDHVVAMLGDISNFAAPTTVSSQLHTLKTEFQQMQSTNADDNPKMYKMPTFQLDKFDDYTQQDPVLWWEAFTTQLRILPVTKHAYIGTRFLNSKGGCQTWLSHLATSHGVDVPDLKDKITWEELTWLWKKRFIVDDAPTLAINRLFTMSQGNTATRDWLTEWQKIVAVPNLELAFTHLRRESYNRSCAALSQALGDREQYSTFAEIIDKAREIIKTNRSAAHEKSPWQPTYVVKVRTGPRQQHFAAVQQDSGDNPAATPASSDGDQVAVVQPRSNNKSRNNGKAKSALQVGNGQPVQVPWVKFGLTEAEYKVRGRYSNCYWCNSTKHKTSLCQDQGKEDVRPRLSSGN